MLKNVQKRATKMVHSLKNKSYKERLQEPNFTTLEKKTKRGDLIKAYKILKGHYNATCVTLRPYTQLPIERSLWSWLNLHVLATPENNSCRFTLRTCGITPIIKIPYDIVIRAPTVNSFKLNLITILKTDNVQVQYNTCISCYCIK